MAKPRRGRSASRSSSGSSSRSPSRSASSGSGSSRSRSRSRSFSSSSSPSRSRSPPAAKARKASPAPESVVLHIDHLSRNVNEAHLKEIFVILYEHHQKYNGLTSLCLPGNFGEVVNVELSMDRMVNLPRGYGYIEFKKRTDAEKALLYMDGGQIDGNVVKLRFTLAPRQRTSSPMKAPPPPPKRDVPHNEKGAPSAEKDVQQRGELLHLGGFVEVHHHADAPLGPLDGGHHHPQGGQEALPQEGYHFHVIIAVLPRLVVPFIHVPDQFLLEAGEDLH
uniref:RRM domain-containing protein n=1 Tax=Oryza glumipatula TaxID=40148 RepID=A0A0D9YKA0_9ORYZ